MWNKKLKNGLLRFKSSIAESDQMGVRESSEISVDANIV